MIHDTLAQLEAKLRATPQLEEPARRELQALLERLQREIAAEARSESADVHELRDTLQSLSSEIRGFEQSHPRLTQLINRLSTTLANLGV
jgi:small-conductance mechanosensitive channel